MFNIILDQMDFLDFRFFQWMIEKFEQYWNFVTEISTQKPPLDPQFFAPPFCTSRQIKEESNKLIDSPEVHATKHRWHRQHHKRPWQKPISRRRRVRGPLQGVSTTPSQRKYPAMCTGIIIIRGPVASIENESRSLDLAGTKPLSTTKVAWPHKWVRPSEHSRNCKESCGCPR